MQEPSIERDITAVTPILQVSNGSIDGPVDSRYKNTRTSQLPFMIGFKPPLRYRSYPSHCHTATVPGSSYICSTDLPRINAGALCEIRMSRLSLTMKNKVIIIRRRIPASAQNIPPNRQNTRVMNEVRRKKGSIFTSDILPVLLDFLVVHIGHSPDFHCAISLRGI